MFYSKDNLRHKITHDSNRSSTFHAFLLVITEMRSYWKITLRYWVKWRPVINFSKSLVVILSLLSNRETNEHQLPGYGERQIEKTRPQPTHSTSEPKYYLEGFLTLRNFLITCITDAHHLKVRDIFRWRKATVLWYLRPNMQELIKKVYIRYCYSKIVLKR